MFIGHFGVGLGAKRAAPRVSLGTLFLAAQFIDLLWPTLLLLGLEHVRLAPGITRVTPLDFTDYPISHSLLTVMGFAALFGLLHWSVKRSYRAAIVLGLCVVSHWFLDLVVHRPDLPLAPGGSLRLGFGLWNSVAATLVVEGAVFATGVGLYLRATVSRNKIGAIGLWFLVGLLAAIQTANLVGPPPPNVSAIAWAGHLQWLFVILAYWVDRHRAGRSVAVPS